MQYVFAALEASVAVFAICVGPILFLNQMTNRWAKSGNSGSELR